MPRVLDLPEVKVGRSAFPRRFRQLTTFNVGDIIPLMIEPNVTPGDTAKIPIKAMLRMQTPLTPVADDLVLDVSAWFVPDRLVWKHFKNFWGENDQPFWEEQTQYEIPQIETPKGGWAQGSLADYFGLPTKVEGYSVSHLPFRAYCSIWSEFFRDENLKEPCFFNDDETTLTGKNYDANTYDYTTDTQLGARPMKAAKTADYFTKCLPEPQRGPDVFIPLGETAPIIGTKDVPTGVTAQTSLIDQQIYASTGNNSSGYLYLRDTEDATNELGTASNIGLAADLSNALGATVNALRQSIALQRYYEALARSGGRYISVLSGIFGVTSSDARLQRPEFLGGKRYPIVMSEVIANTAATNQKLGNVGGMSKTLINDYICTRSFEEHGCFMVLGVVRVKNRTYQDGIPRCWTRKKQTDFYNRAFDHLGEMDVKNKEIKTQGASVVDADGNIVDELPFGYMPAYEDMRLGRSYLTGEMRSNATASLDSYCYADDYSQLPTLSSDWIDEDPTNVDRTLTIQSSTANQLYGDFVFETTWIRGMSMYGTPGFMDHM